jgi:hypothetical protein
MSTSIARSFVILSSGLAKVCQTPNRKYLIISAPLEAAAFTAMPKLATDLNAQGAIGHDPDVITGDEDGQQAEQQEASDLVELPDRLGEQAIGGGMAALLGLYGGLPDAADAASAQAATMRRKRAKPSLRKAAASGVRSESRDGIS